MKTPMALSQNRDREGVVDEEEQGTMTTNNIDDFAIGCNDPDYRPKYADATVFHCIQLAFFAQSLRPDVPSSIPTTSLA